MNLVLEIPDKKFDAFGDSDLRQIKGELAAVMYDRGLLPVGKAMELAEMTRREFHEMLRCRGTRLPFDDVELGKELK